MPAQQPANLRARQSLTSKLRYLLSFSHGDLFGHRRDSFPTPSTPPGMEPPSDIFTRTSSPRIAIQLLMCQFPEIAPAGLSPGGVVRTPSSTLAAVAWATGLLAVLYSVAWARVAEGSSEVSVDKDTSVLPTGSRLEQPQNPFETPPTIGRWSAAACRTRSLRKQGEDSDPLLIRQEHFG